MLKTAESRAKVKPLGLLISIVIVSAFYAISGFRIFVGEWEYEKAKKPPLDLSLAAKSSERLPVHRPEFYRTLAERSQYYPHDPKIIPALYQKAILRGPADYHIFFAYARYLSTSDCCREKARLALLETLRRCPTNPDMHRAAAAYFLATNEKQTALLYFRRSLELEPGAAQNVYALLEQNGIDVDSIVHLTPSEPDALIQLCRYLGSKGPEQQKNFQRCVTQVSQFKLDAKEQLDIAGLAAQAGLPEIALRYGKAAAASQEMKIRAYELLAQEAWKAQRLNDYLRYSLEIENAYREEGEEDRAAQAALETAMQYKNLGAAEAIEKMLDVVKRYPNYAETYSVLANLSSTQSEELQLYYLKKAAELNPQKSGYQNQLANFYLNNDRFPEAEKVYLVMIDNPEMAEEGYVGLSRCKQKEGNNFQAIAVLEEARGKGIQTENSMMDLANLYLAIGSDQRALAIATQLTDQFYQKVEPHNVAAQAYMNLARFRDARSEYEQALSLDPNNNVAKQGLIRLQSLGY